MQVSVILTFSVVLVFGFVKVAHGEFYYKPYNGTIPSDAVAVGNLSGNNYYIGLGVVHGRSNAWDIYGLFPGRIENGGTSIVVPISGAVTIEDGLMILCSPSGNAVTWIAVTKARFYDDLGDKKPVYGGLEGSATRGYRTRLFIGRDGDNVGKITAEDIALYVVDSTGTQEELTDFEVLAY